MKVKLLCTEGYGDNEGTRVIKGKTYEAEMIYDILVIKAENHIMVGVMDYQHNEWFLNHLQLNNVIPLPFSHKRTSSSVKII